ncbi:response regulator transcription factor [Pseudoduganella albidiflava]|uniref:DNA-binding response regulator n=1 Tax=Pseudoduganella albidiflava TaxID=321983 RepID=A0A411WXN5_9BURK|nr:response regulator transcription factor [Pseudoduganella albidiflava]QBI01461.1 response regulator transcription factor [Pseudoduganella albidiflava]GGY35531.1 DNA-binding response regulator [Pseudoduganella albidiflava]
MKPLVYIVDDDAALREALSSLLRSADMDVATFGSVADFMEHCRDDRNSCLLLDVRLGGHSGMDLHAELKSQGCALPVVFMTGFGDIPMSVRAMKAGAVDFLAKPVRVEELLDAVNQALARDAADRTEHATLAGLRQRYQTLTPREREIMALAARGLMNKQIAAEVGTSEITVKIHRGQAMKKMQAKTFADLVRMAEALDLR